jgi:putative inorganic carbon (hco3(-)) transporter
MRGILLVGAFFSLLPLIFTRGPFIGILMWFWVSLMSPQFIVWGFAASIPYALIVAVSTLLAWLLFSSEPKAPQLDTTTTLLVALMIWVTITSVLGTGPREDVYYQWTVAEKMLLMTLVAYTLTTTRERIDQVIFVCALSIAYYGLKGGVWTLLHGGHYRVMGPGNSMIGNNNELGMALVMTLPLLFYMRQRYSQPYLRWALLGVIVFTVIASLFTYSRGGLLALAAMAGLSWLRSRQKVVPAVLAIILVTGVWVFAPPQWVERMESIRTYRQDDSAEQRLYLWRLSWAMALKHPIFGGGIRWSYNLPDVNQEFAGSGFHWPYGGDSDIGEYSENDVPPLIRTRVAHSIWFEMVSDQGFPGLLLFVAVLLSGAVNARRLMRHARGRPHLAWADHLGRTLQASLVAYAVGGTFGSMEFYDLPYVIIIIAAAARRVAAREITAEAKRAGPDAIRITASTQAPLKPHPI